MVTNKTFAFRNSKSRRTAVRGAIIGAAVLLVAASVLPQSSRTETSSKPGVSAPKPSSAAPARKLPRTADGHPDFQGGWANASITPLQRPAQWAGRQFLTDQEVEDLKRALA